MDQNQLFTPGLGSGSAWMVDDVTFKVEEKRLDMHVTFPKGSRFSCPVCGAECPVHDIHEKTWSHMDFFSQISKRPAGSGSRMTGNSR